MKLCRKPAPLPWLIIALVFITAVSANLNQAFATTHDLAADWSDVQNPNGPWALYKAPGQLFTINQPDYVSNGTNQHSWADEPYPQVAHVPEWTKAIADVGILFSGMDIGFVDPGMVYMHTAESERTGTEFSSVIWTAPHSGQAHIDGGVWVAKSYDRPQHWQLNKNGAVLTEGGLSLGDPYTKTNPFLFSTGSGGPAAVDLSVNQNDQIELLIYRDGAVYGTTVGVDLRIQFPVPEPGSLSLMSALSTSCLLRHRRSRRGWVS